MRRYTLLAVASLGLAACSGGCQNSGEAEVAVDADRPTMTADTTATAARSTSAQPTYTAPDASTAGARTSVDTSAYSVPYVATTDTPWMRTSTDSAGAGTLKSGDIVYLRSDSPTTGVIAARTADNQIVFVRAADLRKQ